MITRIELSRGDSFSKVIDVQEYIDNKSTPSTPIANIIIGKNSEGILPDIIDVNNKFLASLDNIKVYVKDSELSDEYIGVTLAGYVNIRSINKSYNYNSISISLSKV